MTLYQHIARFWVENARVRHGLVPGDPAYVDPAPPSCIPKVLAATAVGAAAVLAAPLVTNWFNPQEPAVVEPAEPSTPATPTLPTGQSSLYQYLEDRGDNVPID